MKIGVFDSGIGGITVLSELRKSLPGAEYVYLGDTAHVPYGTKSEAQIRRLSSDCARTLKRKGVDAVVVACNTASSLALDSIRHVLGSVPVIGMVEPGVETALLALEKMEDSSAPVLVLATSATTRSGTYARLLSARIGADKVLTQACPLLVPMIEEGWLDHPILHQTIHEYVAKYADKFPSGVGLLACTHYPWIHTAFERALPGWKIVNSAQAVVRALERRGIVGLHSEAGRTLKPIHWIFTDPAAVPDFAKRLVEE